MKSMNTKSYIIIIITLLILALLASFSDTFAYPNQGELQRVTNLEGRWKFSIGEREEWLDYNFNDNDWEEVYVPEPWEEQGFHGYNGYGTYRKQFSLDKSQEGLMLYLGLGFIDDVDEVFVNGHKIGSSGSFPPRYETAYNANRVYYMPEEILHYNGKNVVVVVVYDAQQRGGIVDGDIGIYTTKFGMKVDISLQGTWQFHTRDNMDWAQKDYDDAGWDKVFVPGKWEDQQYRDYDGYAWYRRTFKYSAGLGDYFVLLLGKIDDIDQVFINGHLIGGTGNLVSGESWHVDTGSEFNAFRGYYVPKGLIKPNQENVIAVRVYDSGGGGGIYEGPVGLITQDHYIDFWRKKKDSQ
jgi:sialate O-acetylesterase